MPRLKRLLFILIAHGSLLIALPLRADPPDYPVYIAKLPNLNDYTVFANGGWDGNWYVGYNTCWIKKLPPVPAGNYARAYVGVKLGRMKLQASVKNPRERAAVPGDIYMAISSTPAWSRAQSFWVTATQDIPYEGDRENAIEGVGESEWFWTEVPLNKVNLAGNNFLAVWSPTPALLSVSSSPVLAAGLEGKDIDTWLVRETLGMPPRIAKDPPGTGLSYFQPAIALKLIPAGKPHPVTVRLIAWSQGTPEHPKPGVTADVAGDSIERVWLEYLTNKPNKTWSKVGRPLWKAPYILSIEQSQLPKGKVQLRVAAASIREEIGVSTPFTVQVSTLIAK